MYKNKSIFLEIYKNKKIKKLTPYISFLLVKKEINKISVQPVSFMRRLTADISPGVVLTS